MEMLASLGLEAEITSRGRRIAEFSRWQRTTNGDFVRLTKWPLVFAAARFADLHTMHQGRFERLLVKDLKRYSKKGVLRNASVLDAALDEADKDFPILVKIRVGEDVRTLRAKYLVGADGAHSVVRRSFDIPMVGENIDQIFGVCDFVPDTTFPDIRRTVNFYGNDARAPPNALLIPREKTSDGHWLCRIYVDMSDETDKVASVVVGDENRESVRQKKSQLKQDHILERAAKLVAPYKLKVKEGTNPIWWATYCVGQRLADQFIVRDTSGHPRVFLVGDGKLVCSTKEVGSLILVSCTYTQPTPRTRHEHQHPGRILPIMEISTCSSWTYSRPNQAPRDIRERTQSMGASSSHLRQEMESGGHAIRSHAGRNGGSSHGHRNRRENQLGHFREERGRSMARQRLVHRHSAYWSSFLQH